MPFREDVLRGVRLFAIAFAAILICVWAYRVLRAPSDVQSAAPEVVQTAPEAAPDTATAAPAADLAADPRPMVVPPPPPVGGVRTPRPRSSAPLARSNRVTQPASKEPEIVAAPAVETAPETNAVPAIKGVGYKSLLEAHANPVIDAPLTKPVASDESAEKPKGKGFFRAVGKFFRGGKKETTPSSVQPNQP